MTSDIAAVHMHGTYSFVLAAKRSAMIMNVTFSCDYDDAMREHRGSGSGPASSSPGSHRDHVGPGKRTLTEAIHPGVSSTPGSPVQRKARDPQPAAAGSSSGSAELQEILKKGFAMTPHEAVRGRDLLFSFDGDEFRATFKEAMTSGAFAQMLLAMGIWEAIKTVAQLRSQVVVPTTRLKPAADTIDDDFKRADEIYNPHGIEIKKGNQVEISEAATKALLGTDASLDEFTTSSATAEELKLVEENRTKGRVTGYWVPSMTSSRGEMIGKPHITNIKDDRTSVVVNASSRAQDTFAHELGHALGLDHVVTDSNNLMTSGGSRNITGPGIDQLTPDQLKIIMKSLFIEVGKLGGK
jgi:hypothetical protein